MQLKVTDKPYAAMMVTNDGQDRLLSYVSCSNPPLFQYFDSHVEVPYAFAMQIPTCLPLPPFPFTQTNTIHLHLKFEVKFG